MDASQLAAQMLNQLVVSDLLGIQRLDLLVSSFDLGLQILFQRFNLGLQALAFRLDAGDNRLLGSLVHKHLTPVQINLPLPKHRRKLLRCKSRVIDALDGKIDEPGLMQEVDNFEK
ncbi:hypothetical protein D3C85_1313240 [compost metagenome]